MMSAAGTPSADPWVVLQRERIRYEEQFRSLKPVNGIITGDQAKGFFLQSQLPPLILGQIWALADTDSDGKMNIDEFSIACKLINLKLRGHEVPKMLPPTLLASLKAVSTPAIPPLPSSTVNAPPRPEPPVMAPQASQPMIGVTTSIIGSNQPIIGGTQPMLPTLATSISSLSTSLPQAGIVKPTSGGIRSNHHISAAMPSIEPIMAPMQSSTQSPLPSMQPSVAAIQPTIASIPNTMPVSQNLGGSIPHILTQPLKGVSVVPGMTSIPSTGDNLLSGGLRTYMSTIPTSTDTNMLSGMSSTPIASSTPISNVTTSEKNVSESIQIDWLIPHQTKLKYTQIFNTADRARTGFLSGPQARNVMIQSKLPQNILAQIWTLSDMDADGRLGCEEFVLAMHLCEQAATGNPVPAKLPLELIPPSFRKTTRSLSRTASVSSQGSAAQDLDPASTLLQTSFEDKRKENFEKGQAELERRRKQLLDQQRKEAEERERKEREEIERREKARQEAERKRLEELEKQMREQQEQERIKEEERKRQADQREAARKEMERQRQLEWEKQRLQELQQQRQREQETVLKLKAKNQSLTIELSTLNEQVKDLSQKICDTRLGVSNVKCTIDGMRTTRDSQMQEMSQLKNKLKEQNAKLLALSQEKARLDAKNKQNQINGGDSDKVAFENKEINIKNMREKVQDMQRQINGKMSDIENNNSVLNNLKTELQNLISECENLYKTYEEKRDTVLEMQRSSKSVDYSSAWKDDCTWNNSSQVSDWGDDNWKTSDSTTSSSQITSSDFVKYRALYEFVARNGDEISFQPGDIINVPKVQNAEPGWLAGEIRGQTGWFPESYVEPVDGVGISVTNTPPEVTNYSGFAESKPLEGIAEISEPTEILTETISNEAASPSVNVEQIIDYYVANYPYQSQEPGDLTFNAGDVIAVIKQEGEWWTGKLKDGVGIFPSNYVQKVNNTTNTSAVQDSTTSAVSGTADNSQVDSEVSQINEVNNTEIPFNASMMTNAQVVKTKKPEIASVIAPYQASSHEQLSLQRGQLIMIRKKTDSGWWEGELQAKGRKRQVGWFPASYVKILNSSGKTSGRTTPVSTTRIQQEIVLDKVVALYPYTAGNPDELSFNKDEIISVTAREEEAWWRGELNGVSGLFPSNYVTPLQQQSPVQSTHKRQECIRELVDTEKAYVEDLAIVCQVFEQPLKKNKVISNKEISQIFLNWEEIVRCNGDFLKDLTKRLHMGQDNMGDLLLKHLPCFTPYISFCTNELDSAIFLQKLLENSTAFKYFLKKCQLNPLIKGMPLSSFLIKPMQRITKYPLLVGKILENTREDHKDYPQLKEALQMAEEFLNCINENIRVKENLDRMEWLQKYVHNDLNIVFNSNTNKLGPRKLLHYSVMSKMKSGKELIGFLFNDMFILVQPNKATNTQFTFPKNSNNNFKLYKQAILIQNLSANVSSAESVEKNTDCNRVLNITDESTKYSILLLTPTVNDCNLWIKNIDAAKLIYSKIIELSNNRRKMKVQIGPACGRLLIVVQKGQGFVLAVNESGVILCLAVIEAKEMLPTLWKYNKTKSLKKKGKNRVDNIFCKVTLGEQEERTDIAKEFSTNNSSNGNPAIFTFTWNYSMQFHLKNIYEEILTFEVLELSPFTPDVALGKCELKITDILAETENASGPIIKKLLLRQVESGELTIKLDLQLFKNE